MSTTWKYCVDRVDRGEDNKAANRLDEIGKEGWELVAVDSHDPKHWVFFLKKSEYEPIC
jgi:hypothetical protein